MRFPDGTKIQIIGLAEIMAELYSEERQPNKETAEEILDRLEKNNNYFPSSARREYKSLLLREYKDYVKDQKDRTP